MTTHLLTYEFSCYWLAVTLYIVATMMFSWGVFFDKEQKLDVGLKYGVIGLIPHALAIIIHWQRSGHGPYLTSFESVSATIWTAIAFYVVVCVRKRDLLQLGLLIMPLGFLMLGLGIMVSPDIEYLPASFQTIWLIFHIFFNKLALAAILVSLGCSIFYLRKKRLGNQGILKKLPPLEVLDDYSYRFCGICFIFWTITIIAGSIWANKSWGRYWAWDPIELWSLITWLIFGLYMHLRKFHRLRGRKAAIFMIGCFIMVIITLFLSPFITQTIHTEYLIM